MTEACNEETINRLLELGGNFKPQSPGDGGTPFILTPAGMEVKSLASLLPPPRIERTPVLLEAGSFADYVNKFKMPETLIFVTVSETGCTFRAMLDYHSPTPELKPAFCKHQASFTAVETPDWKIWNAADRKKMSQVEFAEWLEDNAKLFVDPNSAELLELVTSLHGHANARLPSKCTCKCGTLSPASGPQLITTR